MYHLYREWSLAGHHLCYASIMPNSELNNAYAAGLVDGEGSFVPGGRSVRLTINMTSRAPLAWMQSTYGGTLRADRVLDSGKTAWRWQLAKKVDVERFIIQTRQYMKVKGRAADATLDFLAATPPYARWTKASESAWAECLIMNR